MLYADMGVVEFGEFFGRLRRAEGVNQKVLAKRLGVSQPAISDIERGDRKEINAEEVERVLKAVAEASGMNPQRYEKILAEGMGIAGIVYIPKTAADIDLPELVREAVEDERDPRLNIILKTFREGTEADRDFMYELTLRTFRRPEERDDAPSGAET